MATILQQQTYLKTSGSLDILVGIWLIISPFLLAYTGNTLALWNDLVCGLTVIVFAATQTAQSRSRSSWPSWINLLIGIWLVLAPFALNYAGETRTMWNEIISGIIIIGLAAWATFSTSSYDRYDDRI
jgi:hypothetical protein